MRLTQWTDYALRVLMYCATHQQREAAGEEQEQRRRVQQVSGGARRPGWPGGVA